MAISSSTRKAGPFLGNDATTVFPFAFKVFTAADLRVVNTSALGIESDLVLDVDYTVALNSNQDNDPGGSVTRLAALPTGERLTITSDVAALQPLVLTNNGGFYPRVINDAFDKITIIAQQLIEQVSRSLKLPISSTASATLPDPVANRLIAWNSSANGFTNVDPASIATVAAYADANLELFNGNGTQTAFVLAEDPAVLANLDVSISGVTQAGGEDFTWVGTTLTFMVAPPNGTRIQVRYTRAIPPVDLAAAVAAAEADRVATAADRVQTGLDRVATAADVVSAEADRVATAADRVQTGLDAVATAADRVQTGLDRAATAADVAATADKVVASVLAAAGGSDLVGFSHATTYDSGTLGKHAKTRICVTDAPYNATGDGTTNDATAIQAAITAAATLGQTVFFPAVASYYRITSALTVPSGVKLLGEGYSSRIVQATSGTNALTVNGDNINLTNIAVVGSNTASAKGISITGGNNITVENCQIKAFLNGIYATGTCHNLNILGNRLWGGTGNGTTSGDIIAYGNDSTAGTIRRVRIVGNQCLSNNDVGVSASTNNGDREIIITNNIVIPCDADGVAERAANNSVLLRFGIIVGYVGGQENRGVIANNIVRRAGYIGIYLQGAAFPSGTVAVTGNLVSECGYSTLYSPADNSLRAGIFLAMGGADTVTGNVIVACSTSGLKISPSAGPGVNAPRASITGNTIARTAGDGVVFVNSPYGYLFASNRVYGGTGGAAVLFSPTTPADSGDCVFDGNHIQTTGALGAFQINGTSIAAPVVVSNNTIVGDGDASTSIFNSGVYVGGVPDMLKVLGNTVRGYHLGVVYATALNTRELNGPTNNHISACSFGITGSGTGTLLCQSNTFKTVTEPTYNTACNGVLLVGIYQTTPNILTGNFDGSPPAYGTWARGDQCVNPLPSAGGTPGWVCVTGGAPGTWKAMASIAA